MCKSQTSQQILIILIITSKSMGFIYNCMEDLTKLVELEEALLIALQEDISTLRRHIPELHESKAYFEERTKRPEEDALAYVSNPLNAYTLMKRLVIDWRNMEDFMWKYYPLLCFAAFKKVSSIFAREDYPQMIDLGLIIHGLMRLQFYCNVTTEEMAQGNVLGVKYVKEFTCGECLFIGEWYLVNDFYDYARAWLELSKDKFDGDDAHILAMILGKLGECARFLGDLPSAMNYTWEALEIDSNREELLAQAKYLEDIFQGGMSLERNYSRELYPTHCYDAGCKSQPVPSDMKCYLEDYNKPVLKIAPFKVEQLHDNPKIVIFHDILYDEEIEKIINFSRVKLEPVRVGGYGKPYNLLETNGMRSAKSRWMFMKSGEFAVKVLRRAALMANLALVPEQTMQVINYAIGGHYHRHYDVLFHDKTDPNVTFYNDRCATLIFYMSRVERGGATFFTNLNISVMPEKGSALFWYSTHDTGETHINSEHEGCPVIVGSKWIGVVWYHDVGQEFARPCGLKKPPKHLVRH